MRPELDGLWSGVQPYERTFDNGVVFTVQDVEGIRCSAAMAPLSRDEAFRVLERKTLNELQAIVA